MCPHCGPITSIVTGMRAQNPPSSAPARLGTHPDVMENPAHSGAGDDNDPAATPAAADAGAEVVHDLAAPRARSRTAAALELREEAMSLVGQRVEVPDLGRGAGKVMSVKRTLGKPTMHTVVFDDGGSETLLLQKRAGGAGHKFYVCTDAEPCTGTVVGRDANADDAAQVAALQAELERVSRHAPSTRQARCNEVQKAHEQHAAELQEA